MGLCYNCQPLTNIKGVHREGKSEKMKAKLQFKEHVLKDYDPKPEVYMKDFSRKTTQEERIKIVNYCLEHNKNYKKTAELFDISYTQVYQWIKNI